MPIIKSAIKRARQTTARTRRNVRTKRSLKTATRALDAAVAQKDTKNLNAALSEVQSALDTAVKKNLMHKNKAARLKSRYAAAFAAAGGKLSAKVKTKPAPAKKPAAKKPASKKTTVKKPSAKKK